eukprot:TRINITY_DN12529_c0_g2_i1.p2 TRINITY_DN12529_c0_g2~~TRINITY_DN12529_c0_g2_i1.p2  ORF type:complete len:117 (-),score=1.71 TRINITY_DN12529_c0_g2_i1:44-394(-)
MYGLYSVLDEALARSLGRTGKGATSSGSLMTHGAALVRNAVSNALFSAAFTVLRSSPTCVPAQQTLLKQYVLCAAICNDGVGQHRAQQAGRKLAMSLIDLDPVHRPWYLWMLRSLE